MAREYALLCAPTPEFIASVVKEKQTARADAAALRREAVARRSALDPDDYRHLATVLARTETITEVFTRQHEVELMVRHDAGQPPPKRRYTAAIAAALARLRRLAATRRRHVLDASAEGNQYNDVLIEAFCRNARKHLTGPCATGRRPPFDAGRKR